MNRKISTAVFITVLLFLSYNSFAEKVGSAGAYAIGETLYIYSSKAGGSGESG